MNADRRTFCLGLLAAATLAACRVGTPAGAVDVRDHGAAGDGVADDSAAIQAAAAALQSGGTLHFPRGRYRFAQRNPKDAAAIVLAGKSDLTVHFDADAELIMDNLEPGTRTGTSHAILIRGPASRITLQGVRIRWASTPARSMGDGIRVVGFPQPVGGPIAGWEGPARPVRDVALTDCTVDSSPQTGVIMTGVSGIRVAGLTSSHTRADGLHFNACRDASIAGYTATDTGDDGLALVTYQADAAAFDPRAETFAFPELTDWNNANFAISTVTVDGGGANGVRLAGVNGASLTGLEARGLPTGAAVMIDSAAAGNDVGWHYVASRAVRLDQIRAERCEFGVHVLARPAPGPDTRFADFDVTLRTASFRDCSNWSLRVESYAGPRAAGVTIGSCRVQATSTAGGNGGVGIANSSGVHVDQVVIDHSDAVPMLVIANTGAARIGQARLSIANPVGPGAPCVDLIGSDGVIDELTIEWQHAPDEWSPIRITGHDGGCVSDAGPAAVAVGTLQLKTPALTRHVTTC